MARRTYLFGTIALAILALAEVEGRPTDASDRLCARLPSLSLCRSKRQAPKEDEDTSVYCAKWDKHYSFYCAGLGSGDQRASEFCPYYKRTCHVKDKPKNRATPPPLPQNPSPASLAGSNANGNFPPPNAPPPVQQNVAASSAAIAPQQPPAQQPSAGLTNGGGLGSNIGQPLAFLNGGQNTAASQFGANSQAGAPLSVGRGFGVGPFASASRGTNVNPLQGVSTGTNINAAGLPISASRGVNFGGLIPGGAGLGNLFGGRRRR